MAQNKILTEEEIVELRKPIDEYVGKIQTEIDELRADGAKKVQDLENHIILLKEDKSFTKDERASRIAKDKAELEKAKAVEAKNKDKVNALIADAESYLKENFNADFYNKVDASCVEEKKEILAAYDREVAKLKTEHETELAKISDAAEKKDENFTYKNRLYEAKMKRDEALNRVKDTRHEAFVYQYHLIDNLRMSRFTFSQKFIQNRENKRYTFNRTQFL